MSPALCSCRPPKPGHHSNHFSRPDLIIFDEPTTALDVTTQVEVLASIRAIVSQFNTAAIYITHDLAVVAQMADRIKVLRYGEEVEQAPTRTMLANPREKQKLIRACARTIAADGEVTRGEGELMRAVADSLAVPMPPLLPGQQLV